MLFFQSLQSMPPPHYSDNISALRHIRSLAIRLYVQSCIQNVNNVITKSLHWQFCILLNLRRSIVDLVSISQSTFHSLFKYCLFTNLRLTPHENKSSEITGKPDSFETVCSAYQQEHLSPELAVLNGNFRWLLDSLYKWSVMRITCFMSWRIPI